MNEFDVIVVGAGPSGSSTAFFCAKKGLNVLLIDKDFFHETKFVVMELVVNQLKC